MMDKEKYDKLIDDAKAKVAEIRVQTSKRSETTWALADLLLSVRVVNRGQFGEAGMADGVSVEELAKDIGVSESWVALLRRAAKRFPPDQRVTELAPHLHLLAQNHYGTTDKTVEKLTEDKDTVMLKDFVGPVRREPRAREGRTTLGTVRRLATMMQSLAERIPEEPSEEMRAALDDLERAMTALFDRLRVPS